MELYRMDTCLACYVTNHCNGTNEELVGVYVDAGMRNYEVKKELLAALASRCDKITKAGLESRARAAIETRFEGLHPLACFGRFLPSRADCAQAEDTPQAWFRFSW